LGFISENAFVLLWIRSQNHTNINYDVWSKYQWQPTTKINHKQQQQVHRKTTINEQDKETKEKITTPRNVHPVRSNLTYSGGDIDLSNPLSMSSYKEIQMGYKKLASISSQRTTVSHRWTRHSWIFTLSWGVYNCFPTLESNPQKRPNP